MAEGTERLCSVPSASIEEATADGDLRHARPLSPREMLAGGLPSYASFSHTTRRCSVAAARPATRPRLTTARAAALGVVAAAAFVNHLSLLRGYALATRPTCNSGRECASFGALLVSSPRRRCGRGSVRYRSGVSRRPSRLHASRGLCPRLASSQLLPESPYRARSSSASHRDRPFTTSDEYTAHAPSTPPPPARRPHDARMRGSRRSRRRHDDPHPPS